MSNLILGLWPELALIGTACVLLVLGAMRGDLARRVGPVLALVALVAALGLQVMLFGSPMEDRAFTNSVLVGPMAQYVKILTCAAGVLFVLLAWPGKRSAGNGSLAVGSDTGEYFALLLLSLAGLMLTAGANNVILLFLGLELASIPTYIMVSISRPLPQAQEAGVKYFFLGAMSAAIMLLGFSYLYGATGSIYLEGNGPNMPGVQEAFVAAAAAAGTGGAGGVVFTGMQTLAVVLILAGFAFKMAAVPLHVYAADVYQGAATPLTAMLSVVPKAAGLVASIKVLMAVGGPSIALPGDLVTLVAVVAVLTMSLGNVLALMQFNVKRMMAYSSVAHSGYMLAGLAAVLAATGKPEVQAAALSAVLFYLATYALMNTGVFAVLQQLPARRRFGETATPEELVSRGAASAETIEDVAGYGKTHPVLGLCMAVCALSLVGLPATVGFLGKLLIAKPLLDAGLIWLLVALMVNAAVSAAYYLRLPAAMFFRPLPEGMNQASPLRSLAPSLVAVVCAVGTVVLGVVMPATSALSRSAGVAGGEKFPAVRLSDNPRDGAPAGSGGSSAGTVGLGSSATGGLDSGR
jgi:NADH-quinone oxidoreductase subunit N